MALDLRLGKTIGSGRDFGELQSMICLKGTGVPVLQPTAARKKCRTCVDSLWSVGEQNRVRIHEPDFSVKSPDFKRLAIVQKFRSLCKSSKIHLWPGFDLH